MSDGYIGVVASALAPDLLEVVVGVRGFRRAGHMLASPFQGDEWQRPERHAACVPSRASTVAALVRLGLKPRPATTTAGRAVARQQRLPQHAAPHPDCSCGIYAYHEPDAELLDEPIVGIVEAWGKLCVHARGFRAEHVRVVALALADDLGDEVAGQRSAEAARRASAWWRVPLLGRTELASSLSEFGSPVPVELRPQEDEEESE
jgi:hypothetical protein